MELADDARTGQIIDVDSYVPKTLREELANARRAPLHRKLEIALSLASALEYLHAQGLIHRDIKPSNIIFVNGMPKFADIGLITEVGEDVSAVGSLNFMPPEGPGDVTADIFSLGKVLYELFTGLPCKRFPEPPGAAEEFEAVPALLQLNKLVLKACHDDPKQRFQTANELREALLAVSETVQDEQGAGINPGLGVATSETRPSLPVSAQNQAEPGKRAAANGEQRPKVGLSRRAALFAGVPAAVGGAFVLRELLTREERRREKLRKWGVLYNVLDDKLTSFMGQVGTSSPDTKFLIYSRGTDTSWITPGFQQRWIKEVETRFPALKDHITTMTIETPPDRSYPTFKSQYTSKLMKETVEKILGLPRKTDPKPVLVLMDTPSPRGVYDKENKGTKITNAEVLQELLQEFAHTHIVPISYESSMREWRGEHLVIEKHPNLVIIHRSAFFHPVNELMGLGYPVYDAQQKLIGWEP